MGLARLGALPRLAALALVGVASTAPAAAELLTVVVLGPGSGAVVSTPSGVSCRTRCSAFVATGTTLTLSAAPDAGNELATWGGDCVGQGPCEVTMNGPRLVVAGFKVGGAPLTVRHYFAPGSRDGNLPDLTRPVSDGAFLYGVTSAGGKLDGGTLYRLALDGSQSATLHEFTGGAFDGRSPYGGPILAGGILFGTTERGGSCDNGTVYRVNTDGTGFSLLHSFSCTGADGARPLGPVALVGSSLFGLTPAGGANGAGVVYRLATDGTGFGVLHSFEGAPSDGREPWAAGLVELSGGLYGTTRAGGTSDLGTVFRIDPDGSGYAVLHSFYAGGIRGAHPWASLLASGGALWGMTYDGGAEDEGTLFKIDPDGRGFQAFWSFHGYDGAYPAASPVMIGGVLYGTTRSTIFRINADGSGFELLPGCGTGDASGRGTLLEQAGALYGTGRSLGQDRVGAVFRLSVDPPTCVLLHSFLREDVDDGKNPTGSLALGGGTLFGVTPSGGPTERFSGMSLPGSGVLFRIAPDGSSYSLLHVFAGAWYDGSHPADAPAVAEGALVGLTYEDGLAPASSDRCGTLYRVSPDGSDYATLLSYDCTWGPFGHPVGTPLVLSGVATYMKAYGHGGVDSWALAGGWGSLNQAFQGPPADGAHPVGSLLEIGDAVAGMTPEGGASDAGTIFTLGTTGYQVLRSFAGGPADGREPRGSLTLAGGTLFGLTRAGGASDLGTAFRLQPDGSGYQVLHSFAGGATDGTHPDDSLTADAGLLYGTTAAGGPADLGTVFRLGMDGTGARLLHAFSGDDGAAPLGSLTAYAGSLYGTSSSGGAAGAGTIFSVRYLFHVSGTVTLGGAPLAGVRLVGLPGEPLTDASGTYDATVPFDWTGRVTPTLPGHTFSPPSRSYVAVRSDQVGQDYSATLVEPAGFYSVTPCRIVDTRRPDGPLGGPALPADSSRTFTVTGSCGVPADAVAVSVNATVTMGTAPGALQVYPGDLDSAPMASTLNWTAGRTRANNAVARLAGDGSGTVNVRNGSVAPVHFILDVNGYFR